VPTLGLHETYYGQGQTPYEDRYRVTGDNLVRSARDFKLDFVFPSLSRVFNKKTILGDKIKHVIEPRATYRYVTGIGSDFDDYIRFDSTDILSNTNELLLKLTNRIYVKRGDTVQELLTWDLAQKRYFDPTFGGALIPGQRNVFESTADLTPFSFVAGVRGISPVVSALRISPVNGLDLRWQADYDPRQHGIVDSSLGIGYRWKRYFASGANQDVHVDPALKTPSENQYTFRMGYGDVARRGWNGFVDGWYDYRTSTLIRASIELTYNTDCCGLTVQYVRQHFGIRDDTQYRIAFSVANLGAFGNLKKQDRVF
jgi:LPS-assembly protein